MVLSVDPRTFACSHVRMQYISLVLDAISGTLLLVCVPKRSCVSVFPLVDDPNAEVATLTETLAGVTYATWVKRSTVNHASTVLVVSDFGCRMVAWDVTVDHGCGVHDSIELACPKVASGLGVASSPDGKLVGVLTRANCKDSVVLYDSMTFDEIGSLELRTAEAAGMQWSPDSKSIAVYEGPAHDPRVISIGVSRTGLAVRMDKAWKTGSGLGVRTVAWSPSGSVLAVGTYDQDVLLVNAVTWKGMDASLHHAAVVDEKQYSTQMEVVVFEETEQGHYADVCTPARLPMIEEASVSAVPSLFPLTGVDRVLFSSTGKFLATVSLDKPNVLWIWDASRFELDTVLVHRRPIRDVAWRPGTDTCYLVCGTKSVYVFDDGSVTAIELAVADERFRGLNVCWSRDSRVAVSCGSCFSVGSC